VFTQLDDDGQKFMVAYVNQSNNKMEAKYNSYEGECLTIVWVVSSFRCYLCGSPFTLVTNHQPLKFLMESNQLTRKLAKWELILHECEFDIIHKLGRLIRMPMGWIRTQVPTKRIPLGFIGMMSGFGSSTRMACFNIILYLIKVLWWCASY
jgi:hypothetical protein